MFAWLSPGCQCFYTSPRSLPSPCTLGAIAPTLVRLLPQLHNLFIHFHKMLWLFNEVPSYRCAKCCVVIWTNKQINKQQSLPFSLYIVRVISPILSEKKKVETLRSLHCGCFYTHTHKETNMCRECYFVLWRFEPSQPQRITSGLETKINVSLIFVPHNNHQIAKFFLKIRTFCLDTNIKQNKYVHKHQT